MGGGGAAGAAEAGVDRAGQAHLAPGRTWRSFTEKLHWAPTHIRRFEGATRDGVAAAAGEQQMWGTTPRGKTRLAGRASLSAVVAESLDAGPESIQKSAILDGPDADARLGVGRHFPPAPTVPAPPPPTHTSFPALGPPLAPRSPRPISSLDAGPLPAPIPAATPPAPTLKGRRAARGPDEPKPRVTPTPKGRLRQGATLADAVAEAEDPTTTDLDAKSDTRVPAPDNAPPPLLNGAPSPRLRPLAPLINTITAKRAEPRPRPGREIEDARPPEGVVKTSGTEKGQDDWLW
ncbi:hypothetical protein BDK51DRAFT_40252 [Blyttiomyces helicus]|uniref:Uncharacterized protein n=1 Tax=Blyttiomyces helicus TaxID=388810 RepID=A0A4P9VX32_9FUNG|nr:hypothetical protein BDK51DRAFT_40252 [Blyttiomyces helicus]|eukprot:RKO83782.1 hypothetical protein BDK51DRAFT_40252 [Blyttiomyces helicus]